MRLYVCVYVYICVYTDCVVIEVKESYTVPHIESATNISLDVDFHKNMLELHQQVNAKEVVVGWFSTRSGVGKGDALVHDHYGHGFGPGFAPILLTVDTALATGSVQVKAYTRTHLSLGGKMIASQFQEVACDVRMAEAERIGLGVLGSASSERIPDATEGLEESVRKLRGVLETVTAYIDDVVAGKRKANPEVGRYLMDTLAAVPLVSAEEFEALHEASVQDMYVIKYLVQLTKTQLFFSEKLRVASIL